MKKIILSIALVFCLTSVMFVGCKPNSDFDPYFTVSGIDTEYMINEDLDLSNAVLTYYKAENDTEDVFVTSNMVSWDGTSEAGEYSMTIIYNGISKVIDYVVYDAELLLDTFAENLSKQNKVQETFTQGSNRGGVTILDKDGGYNYEYDTSILGSNTTYRKQWIKHEGSKYYSYIYEVSGVDPVETSATKAELSATQINLIHNFGTIKANFEYETLVPAGASTAVYKNADKSFTLAISYENSTHDVAYTIVVRNGLVVSLQVTRTPKDPNGVTQQPIIYEYEYNNEVDEIPSLPTGVTWENA